MEKLVDTVENIHRMHFLLKTLKVEHGLLSVQVARAPENYFDLTYPERVEFLRAPSTYHLCKTIIMRNSNYKKGIEAFPECASDQTYPEHIIVISQFEGKLHSQKILAAMKKHQNSQTKFQQISGKGFHYRLSEEADALAMTGYDYNAITPFLIEKEGRDLPILLSEEIVNLKPAYLWFSGGRIEIKMGVSIKDFLKHFGDRVIVANISQD